MLTVLSRVAQGRVAIRKADQRKLWRWERPLQTTGLWPRRDDIVVFGRPSTLLLKPTTPLLGPTNGVRR